MDQITLTGKYEGNEANLIHREVWEQPTRDASRGRFSSYQHIQHPRSQSKGKKQNNHQTTLNSQHCQFIQQMCWICLNSHQGKSYWLTTYPYLQLMFGGIIRVLDHYGGFWQRKQKILLSLCRRSGLNPSSPVSGIFFHEPSSVSLRCREMIVLQIFV